ncbi:eIF-2-alpha kinase activator GCN1 [Salvia divinorum]|uniref:EIF-2-alpha kinase activator GCN1 n=1 Tax=Salvia divinorum TaxID=28513 RepID=A0ABD1FPX7_SALDI
MLVQFLHGLISGSAELREQAALGLGELIEVTSENALREFVIPITGPLIRIIRDRFPWWNGSKAFPSPTSNYIVKCLQDNTGDFFLRSSAAIALGKLSALSKRIDPLVGDLLSGLQASHPAVKEAILTALDGVIKNAGKSLSSTIITRLHTQPKEMLNSEHDQIRSSAASILGYLLHYLEDAQVSETLVEVV